MKASRRKESKNLSDFKEFKLNNPKAIIGGGLGDIEDGGGPIDPPKKPGTGDDRP